MVDLKYPIGDFSAPKAVSAADRTQMIREIAQLPEKLSAAVDGLTDSQLDTPYRDGGWTVRQVVHHVADSHINSYVRFRLALTENIPLIKAYEEHLWAELPDAKILPVDISLSLLHALHHRWVTLLNAMTDADFERKLRHPVSGELTLNTMVALYAWHSRHHVAHITELRRRLGW